MRDWVGNSSIKKCNERSIDSEPYDYYATEPKAVELLLEQEKFKPHIWEPACGEGHISEVLKAHGYNVLSTDLIDRGYGSGGHDFLKNPYFASFDGDLITNPPYRWSSDFVKQALRIVKPGCKVAMFLKLTFLEGQGRRELFREYPPMTVYVSSGRLQCGRNGVFKGSSAVAYAWFVWHKGHQGPTHIKWIN